ncbi:MAG: hypothetical protein NTV51_17300 [Verrucomicrobia bacterium]|nr:hypothetical protein [Verrucomicrobiota bacterium]
MRFFRPLLLAGFLLLTAALRAQDNWVAFPQEQTAENLWSLAYGNHTLVVAGEHGTILSYSYVDQAWLPRYSATSAWLVGAGFGAGRFIVVGDQGTILTSDDDGVTWTPRASGTTTRLNSVAYGNGRWLIVGEQGSVLTSTDGTIWSARPSLGTGFLRALAFGQGQFLLGGAGGALYSTTDASAFTRIAIDTTADIEGAAISAAHFWVVGSGGVRAVATQLGTWKISVPYASPTLRGVAVRNTDEASAIGVSYADTFLLTPTPGWYGYTNFPRFLATAVVQGENEMVCVGFDGRVARSQMKSPVVMLADTGNYSTYGSDVHLRVVSGQPLVSVQWTHAGTALPGATQAALTIPRVGPADAGYYEAVVTTSTITTPTKLAAYTLRPIPGGRAEVRDPTFDPFLPVIPSLAVFQPDGKILIAGSFTLPTGLGPLTGLARLNVNGSLDAGFRLSGGIPSTQAVKAFHVLADGRIYVRGTFTSLGGLPRAGLARLLGDGTVDPTFVPDPVLTFLGGSALAPDGKLYVHNLVATPLAGDNPSVGILRVNPDGSRDPSFPLTPADALVGVDAQGRVLLTRSTPSSGLADSEQRLLRFRSDGSPDPSYTSFITSYYPSWAGSILNVTYLSPQGLYYSANYTGGHFGNVRAFSRLAPEGGPDPGYTSPPSSKYPVMSAFSFGYRSDGGLWQMRDTDGIGQTNRAYSYAPDGQPETGRYATLPDYSFYYILSAAAPDGSLLAFSYNAPSESRVNVFRVRPLVGRVGRLTNLSVRAYVASAADPLIAGFVTTGTGSTSAIVRGIGPSLTQFGVTDAMRDPSLTLVRDGLNQITSDDWSSTLVPRFSAVGAFPLAPGSKDAALEAPIGPGNYSAVVSPSAGESGTALVELFDSTASAAPTRRFVNVSARAQTAPDRPLIVGFSITGEVPVTVLIRGIGPALTGFGVPGALADPKLTLYRNSTALWESIGRPFTDPYTPEIEPDAAALRTGAFALKPGSKDSAMVVSLPPGSYSAVVSSVSNTSGAALIEVYEVP